LTASERIGGAFPLASDSQALYDRRMTSEPTEARETVGRVMHAGVVTCRPNASLRTVARLLAEHRIHAVVVTGPEETAPSAVVTDRDVVFAHSRGELDRLTARDAAREPTITLRPDHNLREASETMARQGVTHIVVTARGDATPIGILSSLDIAKAVGAQATG
jgi:CBS domain-containing protein